MSTNRLVNDKMICKKHVHSLYLTKIIMMKAWPHPIKAVIFDNDGVIVDSLPLYYESLTYFADPPFPQTLVDKVNGRGDLEVCQIYIDFFHLNETVESLNKKRNDILTKLLPRAPLIPGVDRVVKKIHEFGIPLGVATSSSRETHELKTLKHQDVYQLFKVTVCGDEVTKAKPSPEIFQITSQHLGDFKPENVLVFEDSYHGICAANEAGMATVFLKKMNDVEHATMSEYQSKPSVIIGGFDEFNFDCFEWDTQDQ